MFSTLPCLTMLICYNFIIRFAHTRDAQKLQKLEVSSMHEVTENSHSAQSELDFDIEGEGGSNNDIFRITSKAAEIGILQKFQKLSILQTSLLTVGL